MIITNTDKREVIAYAIAGVLPVIWLTLLIAPHWEGSLFDLAPSRIDFTDVLLLLKMDGEWKCVAKAYNQNADTIVKK